MKMRWYMYFIFHKRTSILHIGIRIGVPCRNISTWRSCHYSRRTYYRQWCIIWSQSDYLVYILSQRFRWPQHFFDFRWAFFWFTLFEWWSPCFERFMLDCCHLVVIPEICSRLFFSSSNVISFIASLLFKYIHRNGISERQKYCLIADFHHSCLHKKISPSIDVKFQG